MARQLVLFDVCGRKFGLDLWAVTRVTPAAWVTALPHGPLCVAGIIDIQGAVSPVIDLCELWQLKDDAADMPREIALDDQFVVVAAPGRDVVLWVDNVDGVIDCEETDWVALDEVLDATPVARRYFEGAMKQEGEIVLVCDPAALLTPETLELLDTEVAAITV